MAAIKSAGIENVGMVTEMPASDSTTRARPIRPRRGREVRASVAAPDRNDDGAPSRTGYFAAIIVSALGHLALFALVFFVAPRYLHQPDAPPPAYTVKIVDNIPAGDLGTHLPPINRHKTEEPKPESQPKPEEPKVKVEPPKPPDSRAKRRQERAGAEYKETRYADRDPYSRADSGSQPSNRLPKPTPMPTETPKPTPKPKKHATLKPTPEASKRHPKAEPSIVIAKANVERALTALKKKNFEEHVKAVAKAAAERKEERRGGRGRRSRRISRQTQAIRRAAVRSRDQSQRLARAMALVRVRAARGIVKRCGISPVL